jgi:hypothetical protein
MALSVECLTGHGARENLVRTKRFSAEVRRCLRGQKASTRTARAAGT